jgi:hypothetical protein
MVYLSLGSGLVIGNGKDNGNTKAKKIKRRLVSFDDVLFDPKRCGFSCRLMLCNIDLCIV